LKALWERKNLNKISLQIPNYLSFDI